MKTSETGKSLIRREEGIRLNAYKCPAGVLTIGYGHTGPDVFPGQRITADRANDLLTHDLERFERVVNAVVHVPISQNQFDALVSLAYNIGEGAFAKSTLVRKLNAGAPRAEVAAEFGRWCRAGGNVLPGLVHRRKNEASLFLTL
ncbi:glycoside hydrolase family protein [Rudanella paleaurantiibacter]|uniref:Lysozyme n=1 Tax=Rudanella paleaurantiibacter TaxID=2614655 RepID=A0A7J5TVV3_9BACT|nr:lysozyme [Rudanella paleaurantiibacter]KAB7728419.1 glycoside hydrolase family protein [Rudanella paleaurantiibacter]